jgi:succinate-semialdehyde dehydrogenase/glutarate-semialdehyde dehydrogenase
MFKDKEDTIALANSTEFSLTRYFFFKDISRVFRVTNHLQVGIISVNTGKILAVDAPFRDINKSRYGREGSRYGLAEYQNVKCVTIGNLGK